MIIKRAMIAVDAYLSEQQPDAKMIMQVHDELILEVADDQLDSVQERVVALMESAAELVDKLKNEAGVL